MSATDLAAPVDERELDRLLDIVRRHAIMVRVASFLDLAHTSAAAAESVAGHGRRMFLRELAKDDELDAEVRCAATDFAEAMRCVDVAALAAAADAASRLDDALSLEESRLRSATLRQEPDDAG